MRFEIRNRPDYASLHVVLNQGEQFYTESGAKQEAPLSSPAFLCKGGRKLTGHG